MRQNWQSICYNLVKATFSDDKSNSLSQLAQMVDRSELIQMIEEIDRLEVSCRRSSQPIMNLEIGLLSLCQRIDIIQLKAIETRLRKLENALNINGAVEQKEKSRELSLPEPQTVED